MNGELCIHWDDVRSSKNQIYSTRSFGKRVVDKDLLSEALCERAAIAAKKLRRQSSLVCRMVIFASSSPFDERPIHNKILHQFVVPTNDTSVMLSVVSRAVDSLFVAGVPFYKAGVGCLELIDEKNWQHDLFATSTDNPALMSCIDKINGRYGNGSIQHAAQGLEQKWAMRRDNLSPRYTTDWKSLPRIIC